MRCRICDYTSSNYGNTPPSLYHQGLTFGEEEGNDVHMVEEDLCSRCSSAIETAVTEREEE